MNFEAQATILLCQSVSQLVSRLEQTWEAETVLNTHEFHINSENWRSLGRGQNLPEMPQAAGRGGGQDFFTLVIGGKDFFLTGSWEGISF